MKYWLGNFCCIGFIWFENEEKPFFVSGDKCSKCCYFLQRLIIFDVSEFKRSDKRSKSLGAES